MFIWHFDHNNDISFLYNMSMMWSDMFDINTTLDETKDLSETADLWEVLILHGL